MWKFSRLWPRIFTPGSGSAVKVRGHTVGLKVEKKLWFNLDIHFEFIKPIFNENQQTNYFKSWWYQFHRAPPGEGVTNAFLSQLHTSVRKSISIIEKLLNVRCYGSYCVTLRVKLIRYWWIAFWSKFWDYKHDFHWCKQTTRLGLLTGCLSFQSHQPTWE